MALVMVCVHLCLRMSLQHQIYDVNLKNKYLNNRSGLDVLKENIELDNADVEKIVDRYIKLKQKASKLIESNKELLEQVKNITNKYNEREKQLKKNGYIVTV